MSEHSDFVREFNWTTWFMEVVLYLSHKVKITFQYGCEQRNRRIGSSLISAYFSQHAVRASLDTCVFFLPFQEWSWAKDTHRTLRAGYDQNPEWCSVFLCDVLVFGAHGLNLKSLTHKMKIFELHHAGFWSYPARSVLWVTLIPLHARTLGGNVHSCTELLNMLNIWPRYHARILALKTPPHTGGTVTSETLLSW